MTKNKKRIRITVSVLLSFAAVVLIFGLISVNAEADSIINYVFYGKNSSDAGYAEGTVTLTSTGGGEYTLYWADDNRILDGFYPIANLSLNAGESKSINFDYHTAIPAGATRIIASKYDSVSSEYAIPKYKQLCPDSGELLYTFNSYSDVHIDVTGYYVNAETHWREALDYAVMTNSDFIVTSGDMVTNNAGPEQEWKIYERILSESGYTNPVWESDGNHDMASGVSSGLSAFIRASGTDSTFENYDANIPYYYIIEPETGDLFIFMALEYSSELKYADGFSNEQLDWVTDLLEQYYGTGINIYLIEHAPINGFGAGDRMEKPYYPGSMLNPDLQSTQRFKKILQDYPGLIHMSGHTHEDFAMGYNYSNENGTACNMIHIPATVGSTMPTADDNTLDYNGGRGYNSQGYYVEVYENSVIYYGSNLTDKLIYPQYCYIMEGSRHDGGILQSDTPDNPDTKNTPDTPETQVSITKELEVAAKYLSEFYECASYDQYQSLKKLYYKYRYSSVADEQTRDELIEKTQQLFELAEHIDIPIMQPIGDTYYFVNTNSWNNVYAYAWINTDANAGWPGIKLKKVGSKDGFDVFRITFDSKGQYNRIVFTDGSRRTVNISLEYCKGNCFTLNGYASGSIYYNVDCTTYEEQQ